MRCTTHSHINFIQRRLKQVTALLLLICVLLVSFSFDAKAQLQPRESKEKLRIQVLQAGRDIENNRYEIKSLSVESRGKTYAVKDVIVTLKGNLDTLTLDQLKTLKVAILEIKQNKETHRNYLEQLSLYNQKIKSARESKDFETLLTLYNEILTIQVKHEEMLHNYITLLDKILAMQ